MALQQRIRGGGAGPGDHIGDQAHVTGAILAREHDRVRDARRSR